MLSPRTRLLTWLLVKVIFAALLYLAFAHGNVGAARVLQFYCWLCLVISLSAFNDHNVRQQQQFGFPVPGRAVAMTHVAAAFVFIWFGWGWTACAYLLSALFNARFRHLLPADPTSPADAS